MNTVDPYSLAEAMKAHEIKSLSYSKISQADTCLKRLEYLLNPHMPRSSGEARAVGNGYHAGLEHYYANTRTTAINPTDSDLDDIIAHGQAEFILVSESPEFLWVEGKDEALNKVERMLRAYFAGEHYWPSEYRVLAVEQEIYWPLRDGWGTRLFIDLVLEDPFGCHVLVDHKTAGKKWKKGKESHRSTNQPSWYENFWKLAWMADTGEVPRTTFAFDVMTYKGEFERRQAHREAHHTEALFAKANDIMTLIEADGPYPPNTGSFLCDARWCDFWEYCPFGAAFDGGVRKPTPGVTEGVLVTIGSQTNEED